MKKFVTVLFSVALLVQLSSMSFGQQRSAKNPVLSASQNSYTSSATSVQSDDLSVFEEANKGSWPLLASEVLQNYADTTSGNWYLYPIFGDTAETYTGNNGQPILDTFYTKGMAERFTTSLKSAYLDSVSVVFDPISFSSTDRLAFILAPIYDRPTKGGNILPFVNYFAPVSKQTVLPTQFTLHQLNTITVNFHHRQLVPTLHTFALVVQADGPGIAQDTVFYQVEANVDNLQDPAVIDTAINKTYVMMLDSINQVYSQFFSTDVPQIDQSGQRTGSAFFGNLTMTAYLSGTSAGVSDNGTNSYRLAPNYPNPVTGITHFNYNLGASGPVVFRIYNSAGQEMATVSRGIQAPGEHSIDFDASNLSNGVYSCRMESGEFTTMTHMIVNK